MSSGQRSSNSDTSSINSLIERKQAVHKQIFLYLTEAQRTGLSISEGTLPFMVYETDTGKLWSWSGSAWDDVIGAIDTSQIAAGALSADATGRAIIEAGFFNAATVADKFAAESIPANVLEGGAAIAGLLSAGLGDSAAYAKTTSGVQTLLASDAAARAVLIVVRVTETFADGDGAKTAFTIGETDTATKFAAATLFSAGPAAAGDVFVLAGSLTATKALIVTGTAATGTGTGAIAVTVLALPAAA